MVVDRASCSSAPGSTSSSAGAGRSSAACRALSDGPAGWAIFVGIILLWIAAALTVVTGWDYFAKARPYLRDPTMIDVLYFAWVRERIGLPRERLETAAATVADLVAELRAREERYEAAFADLSALRVAVDQELAGFDAPLAGVREVAFFPPMTGG